MDNVKLMSVLINSVLYGGILVRKCELFESLTEVNYGVRIDNSCVSD